MNADQITPALAWREGYDAAMRGDSNRCPYENDPALCAEWEKGFAMGQQVKDSRKAEGWMRVR